MSKGLAYLFGISLVLIVIGNARTLPTGSNPSIIVFTMVVSDDHEPHRFLKRRVDFTSQHPYWLNTTIENNIDHCDRHGRKFVVREFPPQPLLPFQVKVSHEVCASQETEALKQDCTMKTMANFHREQANWLKLQVLLDYCESDAAEYFLFLDADVVMMTRPGHDPVGRAVELMNEKNVDILWANEDWQNQYQLNGGFILVRNCEWSKTYFRTLLEDHKAARSGCNQNEQMCMRGAIQSGRIGVDTHGHVASGKIFNCHPNYVDLNDENVGEIVHFMGGAKAGLKILDLNQKGACENEMCFHVHHCALRAERREIKNNAFVWVDPLNAGPGSRFVLNQAKTPQFQSFVKFSKSTGVSLALIVPKASIATIPLTEEERAYAKTIGLMIFEVDWFDPPGADYSLTSHKCAPERFLILHAFKLTQFRAILLLHKDMSLTGDVTDLFLCAQHDRFMATTSLASGIMSSKVLAFKPSMHLYNAAIRFSEKVELAHLGNQDGNEFPEDHCVEGLVYALLYSSQYASNASSIFEKTGMKPEKHRPYTRPRALFLDPCEFHRQGGDADKCAPYRDCSAASITTINAC
eukprot:m.117066 g.117066  ORF g.117066 m.117066 type:complete len:579 (+) comp14245_c0_seq11:305-2041(+)